MCVLLFSPWARYWLEVGRGTRRVSETTLRVIENLSLLTYLLGLGQDLDHTLSGSTGGGSGVGEHELIKLTRVYMYLKHLTRHCVIENLSLYLSIRSGRGS